MSFVEIVGDGYTEHMRRRLDDEVPERTWLSQFAGLLYPIPEGSVLMDVGCGSGYAYDTFKSDKIKYIGIDFEKDYLELGREKFTNDSNVQFMEHDITAMPAPVMADIVICSATLEHCESLTPALAYIADSVKKTLLLRTFLGEDERIYAHQTKYRGWTKWTNQYSFKDVLGYLVSRGFSVRVHRDEYTDSIPQLVDGVMRTFFVIQATAPGDQPNEKS